MDQSVFNLYKPVGKTPLEMIEKLRLDFPNLQNATLGYAGRLDPMAEGVLIVLAGSENSQRKLYEKYVKHYEFEVLFGIETDTYDCMGIVQNDRHKHVDFIEDKMKSIMPSFLGKQEQPYPPYSSPRVKGKPLFFWARENRLNEITIPVKTVEIFSLELVAITMISAEKLHKTFQRKIEPVTGEFRQKEILTAWDAYFSKQVGTQFPLATLKVACSSGTYVRSIAHEIGKKMGTGAIASRILRTHVGLYNVDQSLHLFTE